MTTMGQQPQNRRQKRCKNTPAVSRIISARVTEKKQSKIWLRMMVGRSEDECVAEWWLALDTGIWWLAHYIILTPGSLTSQGLPGRRAGILTPKEDAVFEKTIPALLDKYASPHFNVKSCLNAKQSG